LASRIIFITGDTASAETVALLAQNGTPCVEKPFRVHQLMAAVEKTIGNHERRIKAPLLIVDDEQSIRRLCMTVGQGLGFVCTEAETAESALESLDTTPQTSWSPI